MTSVGYTTGTFDLFHVGHLNILRTAKSLCDFLIVGVSTEEAVYYKKRKIIIPFYQRVEIVRAIKYVDAVVSQTSCDKIKAYDRLKYNKLFVGDDWYGTSTWDKYEKVLLPKGVSIIYVPYTEDISTTLIVEEILR